MGIELALPGARDGHSQRERIEGCSPKPVAASGDVPNSRSERSPTEDGDRRWELVTRKGKVRSLSSSPRRSPASSQLSRLVIAEGESAVTANASSIKKKCKD